MTHFLPDTLKGQTILVVGVCLLLFNIISLFPYITFSASTVTLEREEQIADRIVTVTRLIEHASAKDRQHLAGEVSGARILVSVDDRALIEAGGNSATAITDLINNALQPLDHYVTADYHDTLLLEGSDTETQVWTMAIQPLRSLFRIHEELHVSINLLDGSWLNFRIPGSAWDHIISLDAIPSLTLMALGTILFAGWVVSKPLKSLSRLAKASEDFGTNIRSAQPISEEGPREIRDAARAFNDMQARVQRLLDARNQMLGAISHDFRTPLTRLRLRAEFINDREQRKKAIHDIDEMAAMVELTLTFARNEAIEELPELVDICVVIREIVENLECASDIVSINAPESVRIMCQPVGIRRVLSNIIVNGINYGQKIGIELFRESNKVIVDVDDAGPGLNAQQRDRVFTPFYRLETSRNRETGGAGLGLSIAQTIIHSHGGVIELHDSPMGGLRVRVILPVD